MGFGIAVGFVLFLLLVALLAVAIYAVASGSVTWPFAQRGQVFEGVGPAESATMSLDGTYRVEWSAEPTSPTACFLDARLYPRDGSSRYVPLLYAAIDGTRSAQPIQGLRVPHRDDWFIRVSSDCTWKLRLVEE
jgi:hypothetical protein